MQKLKSGIKWVEQVFYWLEQLIFVKIAGGIYDLRESILVPWLKNHWPAWLSANWLTLLRLGLSVLLFGLICLEDYRGNWYILLIFFLALSTDFLDGLVARAFGQSSDLGALLDKLADRTLVMPLGVIQFWQADKLLVIVGIFGVTFTYLIALGEYFRQNKRGIPDNIFGKTAMNCFSIAVFLAIWPSLWHVADVIGWIAVLCGFFACCVSGKKVFYVIHGQDK